MSKENLSYSEIVKFVARIEKESHNYNLFKIAFLRNITIDPLIPYLKYYCYNDNIELKTWMGDYDLILQEVLNPKSKLYEFSPDLIIICIKPENITKKLYEKFALLKKEEIDDEINRITDFIENLLNIIRKKTNANILIHNFEIPIFPSYGILDYQEKNKQLFTFRKINELILDIINKFSATYIIDVDLIQSKIGYLNFFDRRYWYIGKAPYTRLAYKYITLEYMKFIRAITGKNKKCLVLDCDNTLWGGTIGEEGINKIKIGTTYPGSCYQDFQKSILNLYNRGILLALCSKNDEKNVIEILKNHPDMILREKNFVSMKINWNDKPSNIKEIALDLNISLDSIVFVDDSEFEINMVNKLLPQVETILLSKDPSSYSDTINSIGLFDTINISEEDKKRSEMYKTDTKRKEALSNITSQNIEDYLKYLEMEVIINYADDFTIPRISQLTQKTNQFNLTTKRYSESIIKKYSKSSDINVFYLRIKDRFGDMGIVGVVIVKYNSVNAVIDTFLLSCRVIGRNIEKLLLVTCIQAAKQKNCKEIIGIYVPTEKNQSIKGFYENNGFSLKKKEKKEFNFISNLAKTSLTIPKYFKTVRINQKELK